MRTLRKSSAIHLVVILFALGISQTSFAQDDPPSRVARLNSIQGPVSFLPDGGDQDEWVSAVPNRPLTTGDRLWADESGRAELHIGSTAIRLNQKTGISFLNLNDNAVQIRLSEGSMIIRLRHLDEDDSFEVDTPNLAFSLLRPGEYRIDARSDDDRTVITVRSGQGEVTGGGRSFAVHAGQQAMFAGTDTLDYDLADAPSRDGFDRWARDRDRREDNFASSRYVSPQMTGYEDLEAYGAWRPAPEYGVVWVPSGVPAGWAPYRTGHWAWIAPWGWTWVDDMPWGFAPYHYGRWAFWGGRWVWVPGPVVVRPVYAPALVAFVGGGGSGFSVAFGGGPGVAWFPLGPREVYVPTYRVSQTYVTNVNVTNTVVEKTTVVNVYNSRTVTNVTNVTNVTYVNQRVPGGVTAVSRETFVNARPVATSVVQVPQRELASAPVTREAPVTPVKASVYGAGRPAAARPPEAVMNRPVVTKMTPPPPAPALPRAQEGAKGMPEQPTARGQIETIHPSNQPANVHPPPPPESVRPAQPENVRPPDRGEKAHPSPPPETARPAQPENVRPPDRGEKTHPVPPPETARPAQPENVRPPDRGEKVHPQPPPESARPAQPENVRPPDRGEKAHPQPPPESARPAQPENVRPPDRGEKAHPQPPPETARPAQPENVRPPDRGEKAHPPPPPEPARSVQPGNARPPNRGEENAHPAAQPQTYSHPAAKPTPPVPAPTAKERQKENQNKPKEKEDDRPPSPH